MKNSLGVEVEPLSEQRWEKIERSLMDRVELEKQQELGSTQARPGRGFPARVWLAAAVLMAGFATVFVTVRWSPESTTLDAPSRITTGRSASHLALVGLTLDVEPESAVVVGAETPEGLLLVLDHGSIVCQVAKRPTNSPLIVQAGAARVRVVGTRFSVTRAGETARVSVEEGIVEVTSRGRTVRVGAGEQWPANQVESPSDAEVLPGGSQASPEAVPPPSQSRRPPDEGPREPATRSPSPSRAPTGASKARPSHSDADSVPAPEPSASESKRPSTSQAVFEQATALERSNPERAAQLYRSLESGSDSWAQIALYAHGRLAASRGQSGEARRLLERYLERFPRGSNAEDARAVLQRLR